jgi:hypothetical protein
MPRKLPPIVSTRRLASIQVGLPGRRTSHLVEAASLAQEPALSTAWREQLESSR